MLIGLTYYYFWKFSKYLKYGKTYLEYILLITIDIFFFK